MPGFFWTRNMSGSPHPVIQEVYVPAATVVENGEPIIFTNGTGVAAQGGPADLDDPFYGVAAEAHAGSGAAVSDRQSGNWIKVITNPDAIFKYTCSKVYTLTGGSTTTAVDSSLLPATNSFWKGGYIEIVTCAADANLNGTRHMISDSTGSTGTLTLANTLPATLAASDTIKICPGYMVRGPVVWDLDSDAMNPDYDTDGGIGLIVVSTSPESMMMEIMFQQHYMGNHPYTV